MSTTLNKKYPIFKENQVLSEKHLNGLVAYLEKEERDTRTSLLGVGIACGLEITVAEDFSSIHISKGTAVTTEGFIIQYEGGTYTHFKEMEVSEDFMTFMNETPPHYKTNVNYADFSDNYFMLNGSHQLLENDTDSSGALDRRFVNDKVVLLLLQANLIQQENCLTTSCDDKGMRLEFQLKPIIVDSSWLGQFESENKAKIHFEKLYLSRFNVPKTKLVKGVDIFAQHQRIVQQAQTPTHQRISEVYKYYQTAIDSELEMSLLENISSTLSSAIDQHQNSPTIQYVYDWMADIHQAYNEIVDLVQEYPNYCCVNKDVFPFHISLGSAQWNTVKVNEEKDKYLMYGNLRSESLFTGFLSHENHEKTLQLKSMFKRLFHIINSFEVDSSLSIKITPSSIGKSKLGERAIPFYYKKENISTLNRYWNFEKTQKLTNDELMSYHSSEYSTINEVNSSLSWDIETYNFFRIEGHIGKEYTQAMAEVKVIQEFSRLPFEVIGINAVDEKGRSLSYDNSAGEWDDLEVEYDLARTEFTNWLDNFYQWMVTNRSQVEQLMPIFNDTFYSDLQDTITEFETLLTQNLAEFLQNFTVFYNAFEELNNVFLYYDSLIDLRQACQLENHLIEEIENRLDEFRVIVLSNTFTIIYEEVKRRWINSVRKTFLSTYSENHCALSHKGGVTKGGTFVMLYCDYSIFESKAPTLPFLNFFNSAQKLTLNTGLSNVKLQKLQKRNVLSKRKKMKGIQSLKNEKQDQCLENEKESIKNLKLNIEKGIKAQFQHEVASYLNNSLKPILAIDYSAQPQSDRTPKKIIIADFYLPYICCGNSDAINIVINSSTEQEPSVGDFDHRDLDPNDFDTDE